MEPNVIVFKISANKYVSPSQLREAGEWKVYELAEGEEFAAFNHKKTRPAGGTGYFISEDGIALMTKVVNLQIGRHKKEYSISNTGRFHDVDASIHLAASDSTAGSLYAALDSPKKVIVLSDYLAIGPIRNLHTKNGQAERFEWLYNHINTGMDEYNQEVKFTNTLLEIDEIPEQAPIYIWYCDDDVGEQTALRFLLYVLADKTNEIFLLPIGRQNEENHPYRIEKLKALFENRQEEDSLSNKEKKRYIKEWEALAQSKEMLRLCQHNKICSVPEQYFDAFLLKIIEALHKKQENKEFIKVSHIIGEAVDAMDEKMSDPFLEYRIRDLVYSGVLKMKGIPKSMRHYRVML